MPKPGTSSTVPNDTSESYCEAYNYKTGHQLHGAQRHRLSYCEAYENYEGASRTRRHEGRGPFEHTHNASKGGTSRTASSSLRCRSAYTFGQHHGQHSRDRDAPPARAHGGARQCPPPRRARRGRREHSPLSSKSGGGESV